MEFWALNNEQRKCFGIAPVDAGWQQIALPRSRYDQYDTVIYVDGDHIRYLVIHGELNHTEHALDETLSPDGLFILPKRSTKPIKLSAATINKRKPVGMVLSYGRSRPSNPGHVDLHNAASDHGYYRSWVAGDKIGDMADFQRWVDEWCSQTTEADLADVAAFADRTMKTVRFREGDVFRFRWTRGLWGFGRILLDYDRMRKEKVPFWDCLMGKPVAIELFRIVSRDPELPLETVLAQGTAPSENIMDNVLHYGEYEIIGHADLPEDRDERCPIMYGRSRSVREDRLLYQQGRIFREIPGGQRLGTTDHSNAGVRFTPDMSLTEMLEIIQRGENAYWEKNRYDRQRDLRNPANAEVLQAVREQMSV